MNRRNFIRATAVSTVGATLLTTTRLKAQAKNEKNSLLCRDLGRTGIKLPVISMGVHNCHPDVVKAGLKSGIKYLDIFNGYQNKKTEKMLGRLLREYPRDSFLIGLNIKGPGMDYRTGLYSGKISARKLISKFHRNLRRLNLSYADVLYLSDVSRKEAVLFKPYLNAMVHLKKQGKVKYLGISTSKNQAETVLAAAGSGVYDIVKATVNLRQEKINELNTALDVAAQKGLGVVAMETLAGSNMDRKRNIPVEPEAAIKYVLQNENIHTVIPEFISYDRFAALTPVMTSIEMTQEDREHIKNLNFNGDIYFDGMNEPASGCRKNLPVQEIMKAYLYAYGYNQKLQARHLLKSLKLRKKPCKNCSECIVAGGKKFKIRSKIRDMAKLKRAEPKYMA